MDRGNFDSEAKKISGIM